MVDNLYPDGAPDEGVRRADAGGLSRNSPMADREIPLEGGHPSLVVQQWLDGEASEAAARRADTNDVELWQRINTEAERRRRMVTPAPVLDRIMAAIPAPAIPATAATAATAEKRPFTLSPAMAMLAGAALLGLGVIVGKLL